MAETKELLAAASAGSAVGAAKVTSKVNTSTPSRQNQKGSPRYRLPLPLRTFPLPTFYPSNPLSLVHLVSAWVWQTVRPPPKEPAVVHVGVWSPTTRSVHVTDPKSINDLWSQGFYGKGSLSRSEPNWLNRERLRQSQASSSTSEQRTTKRREERADTKWERGRTELEAIEARKREEAIAELAKQAEKETAKPVEAESAASLPSPPPSPKAPVGPLELLALPNSEADLKRRAVSTEGPHLNGSAKAPKPHVNGSASASALQELIINGSAHGENGTAVEPPPLTPRPPEPKRQKSVRFSPTVESTTFVHSDPPSPNHGQGQGAQGAKQQTSPPEIIDKEHLQLSPEEAFFLAYGVGALRVVTESGEALSTLQLLELCRDAMKASSFGPQSTATSLSSVSSSPSASPPAEDFLLHYAVYHHFRSLGWTPRHGIKFGVDWMLYGKGPALDHAEFGLMIVPSYSDRYWADKPVGDRKAWHWLHSVNRVLSTVFKSLVLVYVDVPPPPEGPVDDISALLSGYRIREVMVKRWSSNRNRD